MGLHFAAAALALLAAAAGGIAAASPAAEAERIAGIHYAVERNAIEPEGWREDWRRTEDCAPPACEVGFDARLQAVHLRLKWSQLNPAPGVFDFAALGAMLDEIAAEGKAATLAVMAGKYTPGWVTERAGSIDMEVRLHSARDGSLPFVPRPWDPAFIAAHGAMIEAMAAFLRAEPRRYATVALVKNAGVSSHSAEIRLMPIGAYAEKPISEAETARLRRQLCRSWLRAGYSEERVLGAMREMSAQIAAAFPDKLIGLAFVTGSNRFPTIRGGRCAPERRNDTLNAMIRDMVESYGARAVINSTTLHRAGGDPPILDWVRGAGGRVAFQLNRQKVGCRRGRGPGCDPAAVAAAIEAGMEAGALFIEVHEGNVHRHREVLEDWNRRMQAR